MSAFVDRHPTVKMLALSFLLLIGFSLVAEGLGLHIPKGYVYFAMGFSVLVEALNLAARRRAGRPPPRCTCTRATRRRPRAPPPRGGPGPRPGPGAPEPGRAGRPAPDRPAGRQPAASQTARAACGPSAAVPRAGACTCQVEGTSDWLDSYFALSDTALACAVNPATGARTPVTATGALPATTDAQAAPVPFYVELDGAKPPCAKRGQPVVIGGYAATYACQAPGAWLVGPLATARPVWIAQHATSDTQHTAVTYGPEPTRVARAWVN